MSEIAKLSESASESRFVDGVESPCRIRTCPLPYVVQRAAITPARHNVRGEDLHLVWSEIVICRVTPSYRSRGFEPQSRPMLAILPFTYSGTLTEASIEDMRTPCQSTPAWAICGSREWPVPPVPLSSPCFHLLE
jgi:hypothetical protein